MNEQEQLRAKVFISCGQRADSDEVRIAHEIETKLEALGYDTYVAIEEQSLRALKENIFRELETSEYFLFIDFKRDGLDTRDGEIYRGSLFCHQELAIASYLELPVLAFHEEGVETRNGVIGILQVNSESFTDRKHLHRIVADKVRTSSGWTPHWKNQLEVTAWDPVIRPALDSTTDKFAVWFGARVKNRHLRKTAANCYIYLKRLYNKSTNEDVSLEIIELVWSGCQHPQVVIPAGRERLFDAFIVYHGKPDECIVPSHTRSSYYSTKIPGPGDYELTYEVISENFPIAEGTFDLHVGNKLEEIRLCDKN